MHLFRDEEFNERDGYVTWREHQLRRVPNGFVKSIVWELTELGSRQDLIALDRALVPERHKPGYEVTRQELLGQVFVDRNAFAPDAIPAAGFRLADTDASRRAHHVEALRRVISLWPLRGGEPPTAQVTRFTPEIDILDVELKLINIFVRSFFDYAGRAPCIPHLPSPGDPVNDPPHATIPLSLAPLSKGKGPVPGHPRSDAPAP